MADMHKVYNDRQYDYGIITSNNMHKNIKPGSFIMLTEDEILFIEAQCVPEKRPFSTGKLRVVMTQKDKKLEDIGIVKDESTAYLSTSEITNMLKGRVNQLQSWLSGITEPDYLHEIFLVAKELDLPKTKIQILKGKMPDKNFIDEEE